MESYELLIKPSAAKELEAVGRKSDRRRIVDKIYTLKDDPRPSGCEKLTGQDRFRLRQGQFRTLYVVDAADRLVTVVKIGHRRDVYRSDGSAQSAGTPGAGAEASTSGNLSARPGVGRPALINLSNR